MPGGVIARLAQRHDLAVPALIVAVLCFSSGSTVVRKIGGSGVTIACYRSLVAAVIWQLIMARQGRRLSWQLIRRAGPLGVLFGMNMTCFFVGVTKTSVASAELIATLTSFIVMPAGAWLYRERIPWKALPWGLGAFAGVLLVLLNKPANGRSSWAGNGLILCATCLWAGYLLASKRIRRDVAIADLMATINLCSGVILLPLVALRHDFGSIPVSGLGWFCVVVLTGGVIGHTCILIAQRSLPLGTISTTQVMQPALAVVSAYIFLGEGLRPWQIVGIAVVLASMLAFVRTAHRTAVSRIDPSFRALSTPEPELPTV